MAEQQLPEERTISWVSLTRTILGFIVTAILVYAGVQMLSIQSQSSAQGTITIAEVYYHAMGWGFIGLGLFAGSLLTTLADLKH